MVVRFRLIVEDSIGPDQAKGLEALSAGQELSRSSSFLCKLDRKLDAGP
ncbi:hypothetical protein AGR4A_pTi0149 [Agrobacterium tumefaciens str. B6]|uniref:Uncharacterized protein n=1 Tax=Agrobacterium tumefaciens str. B6 TaxID=1183423 RepID=A0A822VDA6_AGRTU|nr:hypothetical protein AGR4A_pTi0149 [Agrobacterium tumefaciens str. B6]